MGGVTLLILNFKPLVVFLHFKKVSRGLVGGGQGSLVEATSSNTKAYISSLSFFFTPLLSSSDQDALD